jgi:TolB-like protein
MNLNRSDAVTATEPTEVAPQAVKQPASAINSLGVPIKRLITAGLLVSFTILVGWGSWNISSRLIPQPGSSRMSGGGDDLIFLPEKSVAVLPFEELSKSDANTFPASGVQCEILTTLSRVADLKVISSTSVSGYIPGKPRNPREIAATLGVAYLVEGSVGQTGEKIRIAAQLTDARNGTCVWKETYERDLSEVFGVVSDIARRLIAQLQLTVSAEEKKAIEDRPSNDLGAYSFYLRSKALIAGASINAQMNEKLREGVRLLEEAIARDPNFYLAYCQLSAAHNQLYFFGFDHTPARLAAADAALQAVIRLRPDAAETHLVRADYLYRCHLDYNRARTELSLAGRALPNNSEIFQLAGYIDRRQNRWQESAQNLQRALGLDPRNFLILQQISLSYQEFRKFGSMAAALDRALTFAPNDVDTRITRASVDIEWKADPRPLHETIEKIFEQDPATAADLADQWFYLALCERDPAVAAQAIAVMPPRGTSTDVNFPRAWCEGWADRIKGDEAGAHAAFLAARAELQKSVTEEPNYGPSFTVLGLIDAVLGNKQDAVREGRHAVELLPVTKDAIDGAEVAKYLGVIYAWCGEKDLAIEQIGATLRVPSTLSYGNLKLNPYWDPLRSDPRFEKIVADLETE